MKEDLLFVLGVITGSGLVGAALALFIVWVCRDLEPKRRERWPRNWRSIRRTQNGRVDGPTIFWSRSDA